MDVVRVSLSKLRPDDRNARKHSVRNIEEIKRSLTEFGQHRPFVVQKGTNKILIGNGMYEAMLALGWTEGDAYFVDDSDTMAVKRALADNRTGELAEWDDKVLAELVGNLDELDVPGWNEEELTELMDFQSADLSDSVGIDEDDDGYFGDARERTYDAYRLNEYDEKRVAGYYQFPMLKACHFVPDNLIGFNYVSSTVKNNRTEEYSKGVHFFVDDYQFERLWNEPLKHIDRLKNFTCVLTPDFSLYLDMPMAMKIWNVYRSRLIGQMMQDAGIQVIPTLQWAEAETFKFCFDSIEQGGTVAVSTVGVIHDKAAKEIWIAGMDAALEKLKPATVVCYGFNHMKDYDFRGVDVMYIDARRFEE